MTYEFLYDKFNIEKTVQLCGGLECLEVKTTDVFNVINDLHRMSEYDFDMLTSISAADLYDIKENSGNFELLYSLYSSKLNKILIIKTEISRENPNISSIAEIFASAGFDEREIYDLFGINFTGHKNLKRILMTNDWLGHPLRKDYVMQDERLSWNTK